MQCVLRMDYSVLCKACYSMVKMLIECKSMPKKKKGFALTVDASTGYISLPNHNKHEEIDGKNTQIMLALTVL